MRFYDYKLQLSPGQEFYFSLSTLTHSCRRLSSLLRYPISLLRWWTHLILQWERTVDGSSLIFPHQAPSLTCTVPSLSLPLHLSEELPFPIKADPPLVFWIQSPSPTQTSSVSPGSFPSTSTHQCALVLSLKKEKETALLTSHSSPDATWSLCFPFQQSFWTFRGCHLHFLTSHSF